MTNGGRRTFGELYPEAMGIAARRIAAVNADQWGDPTPCGEWNIRQVANHLIYENRWTVELFAGKTTEDVGDRLEGDLTGDDPSAEYANSVAATRQSVNAPGAMEATCHLSFGDFSGSDYAKQLFLDTFIHSWDIASGSGRDLVLAAELVVIGIPIAEEFRAAFGEFGVFGDDRRSTAADNPQSQLLAILGRFG